MRPPLSLLTAAAILVVTMAVGSYVDLRNDQMHARQLAISTGLEKIVRLNQALNSMLMMAVLERNTLRSASYQTLYAELERTVDTIEELARQLELAEDMSALGTERRELRRVELEALEHMNADLWTQARALLFDDAYVRARKIYEINSETAIGALNGELAATASEFKRARLVSLAVRAAALGLLLWAGLMFSRRLSLELAEQARLRDQISAANLRLEDKVHARTAELEAANRKLANLSATDGLTGLANRRQFDETFDTEWQRAARLGLPLTIAMLDVDEFKAYNDHFGHQAGDDCLRSVGAVLRACAQRSGDLPVRYGGEEFVVILPGVGRDEGAALAETIRRTMQAQALQHTDTSPAGVVTVSIGVASCIPRPGEHPDALLKAADAAMYEAKRRGRNNVVVAEDTRPD
jgi:diguanylate cyclase (GGDEF)-like protein